MGCADDAPGQYDDASSGYKYATLDGTSYSSEDIGCQGAAYNLPSGWELAPDDADGMRMTGVGGWGTHVVVFEDGDGYWTTTATTMGRTAGTLFGASKLTTSTRNGAPAYGVSICSLRVLIRCGS